MTQTRNRPAGNGAAPEQVGQTNSRVPPAGDVLQPIAGWCPAGGCPARLAAQLEHAVTLAFESGRRYERVELAAMEATWTPFARKTYEQQVAERIADMEAAAARLAADLLGRHGRVPWIYQGGPVDWETGQPVRRLENAA